MQKENNHVSEAELIGLRVGDDEAIYNELLKFLRRIIADMSLQGSRLNDISTILKGSDGMENGLIHCVRANDARIKQLDITLNKINNFKYVLTTIVIALQIVINFLFSVLSKN